MRRHFALLALATALAACTHNRPTTEMRGVSSVNVPVVSRADYVFDAAAPDGSLGPAEEARLDGWFRSLQLGYGDAIYVDGPYSDGARGCRAYRRPLRPARQQRCSGHGRFRRSGLGPRGRQPYPRQRSELPGLVGPVAAQS